MQEFNENLSNVIKGEDNSYKSISDINKYWQNIIITSTQILETEIDIKVLN